MMRLRNSLRCSKNVMVPPGSSERLEFCVLGTESATGLRRMRGVLGGFWQIRCRRSGSESARILRRSEEHTSELQSLTNLVCRLLLEKKKKKKKKKNKKSINKTD